MINSKEDTWGKLRTIIADICRKELAGELHLKGYNEFRSLWPEGAFNYELLVNISNDFMELPKRGTVGYESESLNIYSDLRVLECDIDHDSSLLIWKTLRDVPNIRSRDYVDKRLDIILENMRSGGYGLQKWVDLKAKVMEVYRRDIADLETIWPEDKLKSQFLFEVFCDLQEWLHLSKKHTELQLYVDQKILECDLDDRMSMKVYNKMCSMWGFRSRKQIDKRLNKILEEGF